MLYIITYVEHNPLSLHCVTLPSTFVCLIVKVPIASIVQIATVIANVAMRDQQVQTSGFKTLFHNKSLRLQIQNLRLSLLMQLTLTGSSNNLWGACAINRAGTCTAGAGTTPTPLKYSNKK